MASTYLNGCYRARHSHALYTVFPNVRRWAVRNINPQCIFSKLKKKRKEKKGAINWPCIDDTPSTAPSDDRSTALSSAAVAAAPPLSPPCFCFCFCFGFPSFLLLFLKAARTSSIGEYSAKAASGSQVGKEPVDDAALPQKRKRKTCTVTGCNFYAQARGVCYKHGSVRQTRRLCCMPGCKSQAYNKACGMSHQEWVLCARMQHSRTQQQRLLQIKLRC